AWDPASIWPSTIPAGSNGVGARALARHAPQGAGQYRPLPGGGSLAGSARGENSPGGQQRRHRIADLYPVHHSRLEGGAQPDVPGDEARWAPAVLRTWPRRGSGRVQVAGAHHAVVEKMLWRLPPQQAHRRSDSGGWLWYR